MYSSYRDADVSEEPLIFLSCGHFFKVETLDGHVGLSDIYEVDASTGNILGPKPIHEPKLKGCPDCRAPMLDIHRYNRANKAAQLEESHRRFIASSVKQLGLHTARVEEWEQALEQRVLAFRNDKASGRMFSQMAHHDAYIHAAMTFGQIMDRYAASVQMEEQPYGRVHSMVLNAKRRRNITSQFSVNAENIQHGAYLRSLCLQLRLKFAIAWNHKELLKDMDDEEAVAMIWEKQLNAYLPELVVRAVTLDQEARARKFIKESVEARILAAQFITILLLDPTLSNRTEDPGAERERLRNKAKELLDSSLADIEGKPSAVYLIPQIEKARGLIRGEVFYEFVTPEEQKQVLLAMQREFLGTGHWYTCVNGHPVSPPRRFKAL